jgi:hypothetical protein
MLHAEIPQFQVIDVFNIIQYNIGAIKKWSYKRDIDYFPIISIND